MNRRGFLTMLGLAPAVAVVPAAAAPAWAEGRAWAIKPADTMPPMMRQLLRDVRQTRAILDGIERQYTDWDAFLETARRERAAILSIPLISGAA